MNKREELQKLEQDVLAFSDSELTRYRKENGFLPVMGEGSPDARIMMVGEAPGKNEALTLSLIHI